MAPKKYVVVEFFCRKTQDRVTVKIDKVKWDKAVAGNAGSRNSIIVHQVVPECRRRNDRFTYAYWDDFDYQVIETVDSDAPRTKAEKAERRREVLARKVPPANNGRVSGTKWQPMDRIPADQAPSLAPVDDHTPRRPASRRRRNRGPHGDTLF